MRILFILLGAFFTLNLSANAVKNGDFSEGFKHWAVLKDSLKNPVQIDGKNAACVTSRKGYVQSVNLEPNAVYELSYLVKGENISSANPGRFGGRIILKGGKVYGRAVATDDGSCMTGTFDWKKGVYRFNASKFTSNRLTIHLYLDVEGKLYFTDLKLRKVGVEKIEVVKPGKQFFRQSFMKGYPLPDFYPTDKAFGLVEPGKPAEFALEMQKLDDLEYTLTMKNDLGKTVYTQKRKPYTEGEKIVVPGQERGYYVLEVHAFVGNKEIAMVQSAFISTPAMQGKRDPFFRVNQFGIWTPLMEGYRMMGVGSATLPIIGGEKGDPAVNARKRFLGTYKKFLDSDFELHALYVGGMSQANCNMDMFRRGYPMYSEEYLKSIEAAVTEAAKILKGKVKSYGTIMEIPSHAQMKHKHAGTWVEAMSQQLFRSRIVARAARKIDPKAKITAGGNNVEMYIEPFERIVMSDLVDDFDIYNIDAYFGNWDLTQGKPNVPERSLRNFYLKSSNLARSLGKSPLVENTETGYNIFYGDRYDEGLAVTQAALTARAIIISKASPVSSVALFRLSTHYGYNENKPLSGCMATCWKPGRAADNSTIYTPLPGGAAFAVFARELAFVKFVREVKSADNLMYAYIFTRPDGKTVLCAWILEGEADLPIELAKPGVKVSMYGRENKVAAGKQTLKLTEQPFYLVINEDATQVADKVDNYFKTLRPKYKAGAKLLAVDKAMLYVNNTVREKITVKCGKSSMTILPGSIGELPVAIQPGAKKLDFTINGEKFSANIINNTVKFRKASGKTVYTEKLVVPNHVKPVSALHPELSYFKSSMNPNGHNISVEYSLTYDDKNLYIAAKVDDPTHVQRFNKDNIWRGDSLQFVFANAPAAPADVRNLDADSKTYTQGHNYSVALTPRGTEIVKYHTNLGTKVKAQAFRKGNYTYYNITVPKSEINFISGKPVYFNFVVFDNNSKTANTAPYWLDMDDGLAGNRDNAAVPLVIFE